MNSSQILLGLSLLVGITSILMAIRTYVRSSKFVERAKAGTVTPEKVPAVRPGATEKSSNTPILPWEDQGVHYEYTTGRDRNEKPSHPDETRVELVA